MLRSQRLMRSTETKRPSTPIYILLVDDNRDGVLARRSVLEELGYKVMSAHSGQEALACLDQQAFDLIVTDYRMEPMNGLELIQTLRGRSVTTPIILLSGFADCIGLKPETSGADAVVQKSAAEIATLVRQTRRLLTPARKPAGSSGATNVRGRGAL